MAGMADAAPRMTWVDGVQLRLRLEFKDATVAQRTAAITQPQPQFQPGGRQQHALTGQRRPAGARLPGAHIEELDIVRHGQPA